MSRVQVRARCPSGHVFSVYIETWVRIDQGDFVDVNCIVCKASPVEVLCTVAHCHPAGENRFWIGAEFTCLSPISGNIDPIEAERIRHSMLD